MDYVNLGKSGLKVSRICLGMMTYGTPEWREWVLDEATSRSFIQRALELGINFFDTADMYSLGVSEEVTGRALRRVLVLAVVLALTAFVVPPASHRDAPVSLVKGQGANGVDHNRNVVWILFLGSDARPGQSVTRSRADAIQLTGVNLKTGHATMIGIPRDSYVGIPGHGSEKINAAMYFGGPKLMGRAVGNLVGVQPDYVFTTGFDGFRQMVNAIGGVTVKSRFAFSDPVRPIEGELLPVLGVVAFLDINWSEKLTSTIGYSMLDIDNSDGQSPDAFKRGDYALANVLFYPVKNVMFGPEVQWGRRENFSDGFSSDDVRIQFSVKYNFSHTFGGN